MKDFNEFMTSTGYPRKVWGLGKAVEGDSGTEIHVFLELLPFPHRRKGLRAPLTIESRLKFNGGAA